MTDDELSEKLTVSEMAQSRYGVIEGKHTIDDRPNAMQLHYATPRPRDRGGCRLRSVET
jgi:hypothetical protein